MKDVIEQIQEIIETFKFKQLAKGEDCEIWYCADPKTSQYACNIAIMPFGIAVCGDIGEVQFDVYGRDMSFLAGNDVNYYIHSKVKRDDKKVEYDEDRFKKFVSETIIEALMEDRLSSDINIDTELLGQIQEDIQLFNFQQLQQYMDDKYRDHEDGSDLYELSEFLDTCDKVSYIDEAYRVLDSCSIYEFEDLYEERFEKDSYLLMWRLHFINQCAKKIMKIKED